MNDAQWTYAELQLRAERAESIIEACGCNTVDGQIADAKYKAMEAALARVQALCDDVLLDHEFFPYVYQPNIRAALRGDA